MKKIIAADKSEGIIALSEEMNIECDEVAVTCRQVATNYLATCLKEDTSSPAPVSLHGNRVFNTNFAQLNLSSLTHNSKWYSNSSAKKIEENSRYRL